MHAGIAGAGLMGRLLALRLLDKGWQVTLFDRDSQDGGKSCAYAAAGMLCGVSELLRAEPGIWEMGERSLALWPEILSQLSHPVSWQQRGSLVISVERNHNELNYFLRRIQQKLPVENLTITQTLTGEQVIALEPELDKFKQALHLKNEACLDIRAFITSAEQHLLTAGVQWHEQTEVRQLAANTITTAQQSYQFDHVFDCRGMGASKELTDLRAVRGEALLLQAPEVNITRPVRLLHPRYPLYIVPRSERHYVIGASEIESDDNSPISVRTTMELLSAASCVHSGFLEARIIDTWAACRPTFPDHMPRVIKQPGITQINGLYRHGCLVGPALIDDAVDHLEGH